MKSISAAIVVLTGATILIAGNFISHGQTQTLLTIIGCGVGGVGLFGWYGEMNRRD